MERGSEQERPVVNAVMGAREGAAANTIPCRRCLLEEMADRQEYYRSVRHLRAIMPQEERTPDDVYSARLALCKTCDQLNAGTCMQCGCYVEVRAARIDMHCPRKGQW